MARRRWRLQVALTVVVVAAAAATLSSAQQQQQQAAFPLALPSCPPAPLSLSPCIGYVFGVGAATLTSCCAQLRGFLKAQAPCLCAASKLAPSPVGLLLGQAQTIIPNVCDLPNPCDDAAGGEASVPEASTPSSPPSETTTAPTATTPATEPSTPAADPDASGAPPEPAEDSPAASTGPAGAGSKLPQLLHAAGATSSRGVAAGTVFVAVFLASVTTMYV